MSDRWADAFTGFGPMGINLFDDPPPKDPPKSAESDDSLRERLVYIAGDSERAKHDLSVARGTDLNAIAERYGLKRRNA